MLEEGEKAEEAFPAVSQFWDTDLDFKKTTIVAEFLLFLVENKNRGRTRIVPAFDLCPQFFGEKKIEAAPYIRRNRVCKQTAESIHLNGRAY